MNALTNITPHPITAYSNGADQEPTHSIQSSGSLRLPETTTPDGMVDGIQVVTVTLGTADLPPEIPGHHYIVSMPAAMAIAASGIGRTDFLYPFGQVRRLEDGTLSASPSARGAIVGCVQLARIA